MLFEQRFWEPIRRGEVTVTFRRWKRRQAIAGRRYRTPGGIIEAESVDIVAVGDITDADARAGLFTDRESLIDGLRGTPDLDLYRIRFHVVDEPDPRATLAATAALSEGDVATIERRLDGLDRASSFGPWTRDTLRLIAAKPAVRAADLADEVGRELQPFKLDVRKLKNLGLTISLERGYELSQRGQAYLDRLDDDIGTG